MSLKYRGSIVFVTLIVLASAVVAQPKPFFQVSDARHVGFVYAYAPSIIVKEGTYHVFFCSQGVSPTWDYIRYTTSRDGHRWSKPQVILRATGANDNDMAACDPSVVFYKGFYYMYYSSASKTGPKSHQTVIQVARSQRISGPYLTYTQRHTWEPTPKDPQVVVHPLQTQTSGYGAGQETVVVHDGKLMMWYDDDSAFVDGKPHPQVFLLESTDPVAWSPAPNHATNLPNQHSIDIKFDPASSQFVMVAVQDQFKETSFLGRAYSKDGMTWSAPENALPSAKFPPFAHDSGLAGDENGNLEKPHTLVSFSSPYDMGAKSEWGKWDLFGAFVDLEPGGQKR